MRRYHIPSVLTALIVSLAAAPVLADELAAKPQRIVSINLCLDALLLKLVEPARIDSIYYLSASPQFSPYAEQAAHFYLNHGLAEEIVPRNPDLILAGEYTSAELRHLLQQLGLPVQTLALPRGLSDISSHIRQFGRLTASQAAADALALELEQKLELLDASHQQREPIPAFWYSSNGVVVGDNTLENELMTRAGFHNLALDKHIDGFAHLDLEELVLARPKVLIMETSDRQAFSLAQEYVHHPALHNGHVSLIGLPTATSCIAPVAAEVIQSLMQQTQHLPH